MGGQGTEKLLFIGAYSGKVYWRKHGHVVDTLVEMVRNFQFSKIVALIEKGSSHD